VLDSDASRIGRLVLTNCDAFDKFPPPPFGALVAVGRRPGRLRATFQPTRFTGVRHSVLGYGGLVAKPLDAELTARWATPCRTDRAIARDAAAFLRAIDARDLLDVSTRLSRFTKRVRIVWGARDRFFKIEMAEQLRDAFPDAELVRIENGRTFVPLDFPDELAGEIAAMTRAPA
jgi:pimeloyl-ACP methyl ester carboxylesterase